MTSFRSKLNASYLILEDSVFNPLKYLGETNLDTALKRKTIILIPLEFALKRFEVSSFNSKKFYVQRNSFGHKGLM